MVQLVLGPSKDLKAEELQAEMGVMGERPRGLGCVCSWAATRPSHSWSRCLRGPDSGGADRQYRAQPRVYPIASVTRRGNDTSRVLDAETDKLKERE